MTAPTLAVEWLLARAAVRAVGLLHVVSRRNSGALNPMCAANPIRSERIEEHWTLDTVQDLSILCDDCASRAASIGGTVRDGVALLLGLSSAPVTVRLLELPIAEMRLAEKHPRREPGEVDALVASIAARGVLTPVLVRRVGEEFEIVDGGRRVLAAQRAGRATVPAVVRDLGEETATFDALVANVHRQDLNAIDLAHAYEHALRFVAGNKAELGRRLGISREQISNTIRLLALPEADQERIAAGELTAEGGRAILRGATATAPAPARLADISALLGELLAAKVAVTARGDRTRIVIDVADIDRERILTQLGIAA